MPRMYIPRELEERALHLATLFPIVSITGPRQSGKSTLARKIFPSYNYVSLENPDTRAFALEDPRGFLKTYPAGSIIDEAQRAPNLFSYLQGMVDDTGEPGQYVLSGSQNFLLAHGISQSLAGRTAVLHLYPLSRHEAAGANVLPNDLDTWMLRGGFPRIYDYGMPPSDYYPSYVQTYLERDVQGQLAPTSLETFRRFLRLCAGRCANIVDMSALSSEAGVNIRTAKSWLSILSTSMVVRLVQPYYRNFNKRLVKRPKLYFCDTGLACSLLGIRTEEQLSLSPFRGSLFENLIFAERFKRDAVAGHGEDVWFWQETATNEVDLVVEEGRLVSVAEVKSGATFQRKWFSSMRTFTKLADVPPERRRVVYGGDEDLHTTWGEVTSWRSW